MSEPAGLVSTIGTCPSNTAWLGSSFLGGMAIDKAPFAFETSFSVRAGELSRCFSMALIAACSSAKSSICRPLDSTVSSSSLEFCAESGGEIIAPAGIWSSSTTEAAASENTRSS